MAMRIAKNQVRTVIYTDTHRIEGFYFKIPDSRLLDDLNGRKDFIPLSRVKIASLANWPEGETLESDMVIVNKNRIALFVPESKKEG